MVDQKNQKPAQGALNAFVALFLVVALFLAFTVDLSTCPRCKGHEVLYALATLQDCPTCHGKGKVTLPQYMLHEIGH